MAILTALFVLSSCHKKTPEPTVIYVDRVVHDSILQEVVKADTIIKYLKEEYNENYNLILDESLDDDYEFFSKYIDSYNKR